MLTTLILSDLNSDLSATNVKCEMRYDYWKWLGWDLNGGSHDGLPHHSQKRNTRNDETPLSI